MEWNIEEGINYFNGEEDSYNYLLSFNCNRSLLEFGKMIMKIIASEDIDYFSDYSISVEDDEIYICREDFEFYHTTEILGDTEYTQIVFKNIDEGSRVELSCSSNLYDNAMEILNDYLNQ